MNTLSLDTINKLSPYRVVKSSDNDYWFVTVNGINYNINGGYQRNVTLNGKEYLIEWVGDSINFMIIISK